MRKKITENIKLQSYEDLFHVVQENEEATILEVPLEELHEFENHPFRVLDDAKMDETVESIKKMGVLSPGLVRNRLDGGYEIISGHRRKRACELVGLKTMPVIVKNLTDDEATIIMVDSNIQREEITVFEKAKAFRMRYEADRHQGKKGGLLLQEIGETAGESYKQVQRYIWLSRLNDELLEMIDHKLLGFTQGVDLSFLTEEEQCWIVLLIKMNGLNISTAQSDLIKKMSKDKELTFEVLQNLLTEKKLVKRKFSMNEAKISKYFDARYSSEEIETIILELLEKWKGEGANGDIKK